MSAGRWSYDLCVMGPRSGWKEWRIFKCVLLNSQEESRLWWSKVGNCKWSGKALKGYLTVVLSKWADFMLPTCVWVLCAYRQPPLIVTTSTKWCTCIYSIKSRKISFDILLVSLIFSGLSVFYFIAFQSLWFPSFYFGINLVFFYLQKVEA